MEDCIQSSFFVSHTKFKNMTRNMSIFVLFQKASRLEQEGHSWTPRYQSSEIHAGQYNKNKKYLKPKEKGARRLLCVEKILLFEGIKVFSLMVFLEGNHKIKFLAEIYKTVRGGMGGWGVKLYCPPKKIDIFYCFYKGPELVFSSAWILFQN